MFIVVKSDYLKYNQNRNPYKIKQKLQNPTKAMSYNVICHYPLVRFHKGFHTITPPDVA